MENNQFHILPKYIPEVAERIMDLQLRYSIGRDFHWVLVDVSYDPNDKEQSKAVERIMDIEDE